MIFTKVLQKGGGGIPSGHTKTKRSIGAQHNMAHSIVLVLVLVYILLPFLPRSRRRHEVAYK